MIKYYLHFLVAAALVCSVSCSSDDPEVPEPEVPEQPAEPTPEPPPEPEPDPTPTFAPELKAGTIRINTAGGAAITSKEDYIDCTVEVSHELEDWNLEEVTAGIRGRGNSSWLWYDKKPYRIKFDKKQKVLGLPKAKSWVLLAEYRDPTDLMNAFVFEYADLLGLPFTNHNRWVELELNGEYMGLYHLTEQVQQNENRVNVDEKSGYLICLDADDGPQLAPQETDNFWSDIYSMPVCVKNPDEPSSDILTQVRGDLAKLESAIASGDYTEVCSLLDVKSMIDFLMLQELVYNVELDAPRSMYMHRDVGGLWVMGPVWDFDAGFDFDWSDMYTGHHFFANYRELVLGTDPARHKGAQYRVPGFFSDLFKMPEFVEAYKARWKESRPLVEEAWQTALSYYNANSEVWQREARRWNIGLDHVRQISLMEKWLSMRADYLDTIINNY